MRPTTARTARAALPAPRAIRIVTGALPQGVLPASDGTVDVVESLPGEAIVGDRHVVTLAEASALLERGWAVEVPTATIIPFPGLW
jgi:hypothetical protein